MQRLELELTNLGFDQVNLKGRRRFRRGKVAVDVFFDVEFSSAEAAIDGKMNWQTINFKIPTGRGLCKARNAFAAGTESDIKSEPYDLEPGIEWFIAKVKALGELAS